MKITQLGINCGKTTIEIGEGDDKAVITLLSVDRGFIKLGIAAPRHIKISDALTDPNSERKAGSKQ